MNTSDLSNLKKRIKEIQDNAANVATLTPDDWDCLSEEQQEQFVRDMVGVRNILRATMDRYFDW